MGYRKKLSRIFSFLQNTIKVVLEITGGILKWIRANKTKLNISIILTLFGVFLVISDIPNYPLWFTEEIPTKTYSYIDTDYGNYLSYEIDYIVKYRKWSQFLHQVNISILPPEYDISISLPIKVDGYKDVSEAMGRKIDIWADAPNDTIKIKNINKVNPLLLRISFVSEESIDPEMIVIETPLPEIQNNSIMLDSFFVKIKNSGGHDIKSLRHRSNVTKWIDVYFKP
ncbi:Uncharacterised protein [uncultured archaeon]|nr:Uncharacterised protein [uncultured archaeon]